MTYAWKGIDRDTGFDYDDDRYDNAMEELQNDADECEAVRRAVMEENREFIADLCGGSCSADYAATIGRHICEAADRAWHRRTLDRIDALNESAALSRAGL